MTTTAVENISRMTQDELAIYNAMSELDSLNYFIGIEAKFGRSPERHIQERVAILTAFLSD